MAGRDKETSDEKILAIMENIDDAPVVVASEVAEELNMSRQGVHKRLQDLENEGYVYSAIKSGRRVWWVSPNGKDQIIRLPDILLSDFAFLFEG